MIINVPRTLGRSPTCLYHFNRWLKPTAMKKGLILFIAVPFMGRVEKERNPGFSQNIPAASFTRCISFYDFLQISNNLLS